MNHLMLSNRLQLAAFIMIVALLLAACGCTNKSRQPVEYYCAEGFHLQQGVCVPDEGPVPDMDETSVPDGDKEIERFETSDDDMERHEAIESGMDSDNDGNIIPIDADIDDEMQDELDVEPEMENEAVEVDTALIRS